MLVLFGILDRCVLSYFNLFGKMRFFVVAIALYFLIVLRVIIENLRGKINAPSDLNLGGAVL